MLKREQLLPTGSVMLHKYYFDSLCGPGQAGAGELHSIAETFGSFDTWETEFLRIGAGLDGDSHWVVLGDKSHIARVQNYWLADHAHEPTRDT